MKKLDKDNQPTDEPVYSQASKPSDSDAGINTDDSFVRFNAANTVFSRAQWDPSYRSGKGIDYIKSLIGYPQKIRASDGYQQRDFAVRNASWVMANLMMERSLPEKKHDGFTNLIKEYQPVSKNKTEVDSPPKVAAQIKKIGKVFGADLVGIAAIDKRWHYTHRFDSFEFAEKQAELPDNLLHCIVIGISMSHEIVSTYPSALAGIAPGLGYSKESFVLQSLSQYIRNIGYEAYAALSDTAIAIPYAIQAGLGEYGRNGLLISKEFGPRVRFGMIFTNLPMQNDKPVQFGVNEFCQICNKCATACPAKAISFSQPDTQIYNQSNITGVKKWSVNGETCFQIWANQGTECGICIRVCPYNKDNTTLPQRIYYRFFRRLAASPLKKVALWLDTVLEYGKRTSAQKWWNV